MSLLPPPGPLQWLFPELLRAERALRAGTRATDLSRLGCVGERLLHRLADTPPAELRLPPGPRPVPPQCLRSVR